MTREEKLSSIMREATLLVDQHLQKMVDDYKAELAAHLQKMAYDYRAELEARRGKILADIEASARPVH